MKKMLKKLTLSPAEQSALDELIGEIRKLWPKTKFKLFGSKVTGIADAESDLDLLIQLPFPVTEEIRRQIIHKTFDLNLAYESNISVLIVSQQEWEDGLLSVLPIHAAVELEGIAL
jgi:DNA polymerase sigma